MGVGCGSDQLDGDERVVVHVERLARPLLAVHGRGGDAERHGSFASGGPGDECWEHGPEGLAPAEPGRVSHPRHGPGPTSLRGSDVFDQLPERCTAEHDGEVVAFDEQGRSDFVEGPRRPHGLRRVTHRAPVAPSPRAGTPRSGMHLYGGKRPCHAEKSEAGLARQL